MMSAYRVALIDLVSQKQIDDVRALIKKGCNVNEKNYCGGCAVLTAVEHNDLDMLKILVEEGGAELNVTDPTAQPILSRVQHLYKEDSSYEEVFNYIQQKLSAKKIDKIDIVESSSKKSKSASMAASFEALGLFNDKKLDKRDEEHKQQETTLNQYIISPKQNGHKF